MATPGRRRLLTTETDDESSHDLEEYRDGLDRRRARKRRLPGRSPGRQAAIRWHAEHCPGVSDPVAADLGSDRLDLEVRSGHRPDVRAVVRRRHVEVATQRWQARLPGRRVAAVRRDPRRAGRGMGDEGRPAASRSQIAQGRDVPREARRDAVARTRRAGCRRHLQPARQESEESSDLLRSHREGRGRRQAHGRVHTSTSTTPSGTTGSAGATTRVSSPRR